MTTEAVLTKRITRLFRQQGAVVYQTIGGVYADSGWPDRWVGWEGFSCWIEFKTKHNKVTALQRVTGKRILKAGVAACVGRLFPTGNVDIEGFEGNVLAEKVPWEFVLSVIRELHQDNGINTQSLGGRVP